MNTLRKTRNSGFTIIELMIVLIIVAIIMGIVLLIRPAGLFGTQK